MPATVDIRGVEEGDAKIKRAIERPDRLDIIDVAPASRVAIMPEGSTDGPAAQPNALISIPLRPSCRFNMCSCFVPQVVILVPDAPLIDQMPSSPHHSRSGLQPSIAQRCCVLSAGESRARRLTRGSLQATVGA